MKLFSAASFSCRLIVSLCLSGSAALSAEKLPAKAIVKIQKRGADFALLRDGVPFYVKGVCGIERLDLAASLGANSMRTYSSDNARAILDQAKANGLTVTLGVWLSHKADEYKNPAYRAKIRQEVRALVLAAKEHPATLMYSLGNETNSGADSPAAWAFINELADTIHKADPDHPVMTVLMGSKPDMLNNVAKHAPALDLLGINAYGSIFSVPKDIESSNFKGAYVISEFGPLGPWEVPKTSWGAPIELSSDKKALFYKKAADFILENRARCIGSYVFQWGQKQERTPTWFGMFLENRPALGLRGEACPTVEMMGSVWGAPPPKNQSPIFQGIKVNGAEGTKDWMVSPKTKFTVEMIVKDPDDDPLTYCWEVLAEATQLGEGGSKEERPQGIQNAVKAVSPGAAEVIAPQPGKYRIFGYALDGKGHAATMNLPFLVR